MDINVGDKVHYDPGYGPKENGMVKSIHQDSAWVVYKCAGEWDKFMDYTGAKTSLKSLKPGWADGDLSNITH